ncbi:hypothetical protein PPACK8108_LOCUS2313 [Phakopsora pachyrhizi]|uniref:RING-type E3 ubiquitin transferase n=1 Tax=Phakopsora pachyrhizi TaxID=170000 RepID=A0AAV0AKL4_PHAPC|nr:hypothetical protein PPACK8108_LOCUS2313 [Phakopsora pachyrhizi]
MGTNRGGTRITGRGKRQFGALLTAPDGSLPQETSAKFQLTINSQSVPSETQSSKSGNDKSRMSKRSDFPKSAPKNSNNNPQSAALKGSSLPKVVSDRSDQSRDGAKVDGQKVDGKGAKKGKGKEENGDEDDDDEEEEEEEDVCLICAEPIEYYAIGVCSHQTCHICCLRMRALYKKRDCPLCKTELPAVVFTTQSGALLSSFDFSRMPYKDPHLSIYCETLEQMENLLSHLKFNCPHPDCDAILSNWKDLKYHTSAVHDLVLCDLCCSNKRVFSHEHTLFTSKGLIAHRNNGSVGIGVGIPGFRGLKRGESAEITADDGFKGHPKCQFCKIYFYDDDQLYKHCKEKHEQCFICVRNDTGRWQYYTNYQHLETHFRDDHYLCNQSQCLESKFIVYETALELQAHQIETHGAELGVKAVKDARRLETNFVYANSPEQHLFSVTARQDLRSSRQNSSNSTSVMDIRPPESRNLNHISSNTIRVVPGLQNLNRRKPERDKPVLTPSSASRQSQSNGGPSASSSKDLADDQINLQQHAALLEQVSEAVGGVERKITAFKAAVKTYRSNEMAAPDFLDSLCHILEHRPAAINSVLSHLVNILDISYDRKNDLLEKWYDLKLEQVQFPSLEGQQSSSHCLVASYSGLNLNGRHDQSSRLACAAESYPKLINIRNSKNQNVPGLGNRRANYPVERKTTPWVYRVLREPGIKIVIFALIVHLVHFQLAAVAQSQQPAPQVRSSSGNFPSLPARQTAPESQDTKKINNMFSKAHLTGKIINDNNLVGSSSSSGNNLRGRGSTTSEATNGINPSAKAGTGPKKPKKTILFTNSR